MNSPQTTANDGGVFIEAESPFEGEPSPTPTVADETMFAQFEQQWPLLSALLSSANDDAGEEPLDEEQVRAVLFERLRRGAEQEGDAFLQRARQEVALWDDPQALQTALADLFGDSVGEEGAASLQQLATDLSSRAATLQPVLQDRIASLSNQSDANRPSPNAVPQPINASNNGGGSGGLSLWVWIAIGVGVLVVLLVVLMVVSRVVAKRRQQKVEQVAVESIEQPAPEQALPVS